MVGMPSDFQRLTVKVFADSTQVTVKFCFSGRVDQMYTMFGAEGDMEVVFY